MKKSVGGDDARNAWRLFLEAHAALFDVLEAELVAERGLPLTWYDVLFQLDAHGGRMRMIDLAHSVLLSKSGLTRLIDRVERDGLVRRTPDPEDGRGTLAILTPKGRATLRRASPVHVRGIKEHFGRNVTAAEAKAMIGAFTRILQAQGRGDS